MNQRAWAIATALAHRHFLLAMRYERRAARLYEWASSRKAEAWLTANVPSDPGDGDASEYDWAPFGLSSHR